MFPFDEKYIIYNFLNSGEKFDDDDDKEDYN